MKKRGISTIVATVLIVLITVAAVTILWAALSPLIGENLGSGTGCFNVQDAVAVDADKTYTCKGTDFVQVRVERAANSDTLESLELIVTSDGSTAARTVREDVPSENGADVYNMTGLTLGTTIEISIAPQILVDGENSSCTASPAITVKNC